MQSQIKAPPIRGRRPAAVVASFASRCLPVQWQPCRIAEEWSRDVTRWFWLRLASVSGFPRLWLSIRMPYSSLHNPAHRTGRAVFPHPALGRGGLTASHTDWLWQDAQELDQTQFFMQVRVRIPMVAFPPNLVLLAEPSTEPAASVLHHDPVGRLDCPHAEVVRPAPNFPVQVFDHIAHVLTRRAPVGAFADRQAQALDLLIRRGQAQVVPARAERMQPSERVA